MSPTLRLRYARQEELPSMARVAADAYKDDPVSRAFFPERLRVNPGNKDEFDFRLKRMQASFSSPETNFLVVVGDESETEGLVEGAAQEVVLGFALWVSPRRPGPDKTAEEKFKQKAETAAGYPSSYDVEFLAEYEARGGGLIEAISAALGDEAVKDAWYLQILCVDPKHHRRGIGKMLARWGLDRAEKERRAIYFIASEPGKPLYLSVGYEEVETTVFLGKTAHAMVKRAPSDARSPEDLEST